jgi:MFS family permease
LRAWELKQQGWTQPWIAAALGVTATVSYGVLGYAFSIVIVPMQRSLGWSRAELTGAYSLAILVSGAAALAVGRLLDRRSPRLPMTLGSALAAALVLAWSRVDSLLELYLVFAGIGVAMALVLYEAVFVVVTKWFVVRRGAALTTVTLMSATTGCLLSTGTARRGPRGSPSIVSAGQATEPASFSARAPGGAYTRHRAARLDATSSTCIRRYIRTPSTWSTYGIRSPARIGST